MNNLMSKSPYELLIMNFMAQQNEENLFNLISNAVAYGINKAFQSSKDNNGGE